MAKFQATNSSFTMIPEGAYVFKIIEVDDSKYEDFGKLNITMQTKGGQKHTERYSLLSKDGEINEIANRIYTFFHRTALNNFNLDEIDTTDIIGCYIKARVEHVESTTINENTGKPYVNVKLQDLAPACKFETESKKTVDDSVDDLDDLDELDDLD